MKSKKRARRRAAPGQGRERLRERAMESEVTRTHNIGYFTENIRGDGWSARCRDCDRMIVIIPKRVPIDGGIGGSATKVNCDHRYGFHEIIERDNSNFLDNAENPN